jgi:hypothetical protein
MFETLCLRLFPEFFHDTQSEERTKNPNEKTEMDTKFQDGVSPVWRFSRIEGSTGAWQIFD